MEDNSKDIKKVIIIAALIVVFVIGIAIGVIIAVLGTAKQTASVPENTAISTSSDEPAITVPTDADDVTSVVFETATGADSTSDNQPAVSTAVSVASPAGAPSGAAQTSNGISVSCKTGNSWENGGKTCTQIDAVISNNGSSTVSGWTLEMTVPSGANIEQSWNGTYTLNGTTLKIVSDNSNSEIKAGASSTTGFIIAASGKYNPSGVKINGSAVSTSQPSGNNTTQQQQQSNPAGNDTVKKTDAAANLKRADKAVQGDDWLSVKGNKIVDKNGKEVWLTGCNWFGYNTGTNIFDGVWNCNLEDSIASIADHGFNVLRVPISAELINQWASGTYPTANFNQALNPNLNGKNSLEIFDYVVENCEANGIKIIIDIHSAETNAMGHMTSLWYTDKISDEQYYASLEWMSARYKNNDTVIAYDIKNEPHGKPSEGLSGMAIWNNSTAKNNWKYTAETAAKKVLAKNPNVLILVEGTESYPKDIKKNNFTSTNMDDYNTTWWGGNLRGVKDYPINLGKYQNKLVYSPHDYGPAVYQQPWFQKNYTYQSLMKDCWRDNWFYIYENGTAPLLIGEWGGYMTEPNLTWMKYMRQLIKENKLNHTFWCFNANSGDTGGLVKDDFTTWDTEKYNFVKEVLWQQNGKFVGLDHKVPLGNNGITLSDAK